MCGICGIWSWQRDNHTLRHVLRMNQAQRHRGPDDEGYVFIQVDGDAFLEARGEDTQGSADMPDVHTVEVEQFDLVLGSRRLAILDLSPSGHMPMSFAGGRYWITYNGEIYNYRELRQTLEEKGHTFHSETDTEVILAAYAQWGTDCLHRLNGMFAFALWDAYRRVLFCARDRFGIKPFYYCLTPRMFAFASELKGLLQHPSVSRDLDEETVYDYLVLGLSDHAARTFFADIRPLMPGHYLLIHVDTPAPCPRRWWQVEINPAVDEPACHNEEEIVAEFVSLLEDAVRLRLRSDVPVGSALSGGLDSSVVVSVMNRLLTQERDIPAHLIGTRLKTFTARNLEPEIDEYRYSHQIVELTGAEEFCTLLQPQALWNALDRFVWALDEPVNSTSQFAQWSVMELAKQGGVTVLLDGQGGDEILAGYYAYLPPYIEQIRHQQGLWPALEAALQVIRVGGRNAFHVLYRHYRHMFPGRLARGLSALSSHRPLPGQGGSALQDWQLAPSFMARFQAKQWHPTMGWEEGGLVGLLHRDLTSTNLPKLLRYEDRNSMAFSLETRLPFLDYRLVEFVSSLPLSYRIRRGWSKWILRRGFQDMLPREICWRRTKLGFPTPEFRWLLAGSSRIRTLLGRWQDSPLLTRYVRRDAIRTMLSASDEEMVQMPGLWRVINFLLWHERYVEEP